MPFKPGGRQSGGGRALLAFISPYAILPPNRFLISSFSKFPNLIVRTSKEDKSKPEQTTSNSAQKSKEAAANARERRDAREQFASIDRYRTVHT